MASLLRPLLDLLFPPLCAYCKERTPFCYLCPTCWDHSRLADPQERCRHCFTLLEELSHPLCLRCRKKPALPIPRAFVFEEEAPLLSLPLKQELAPYLLYQWVALDLFLPDFVIPLPGPFGPPLAKALSALFQEAFALPKTPYSKGVDGACGEVWPTRHVEKYQDKKLLLIDPGGFPLLLQPTIEILLDPFPERCFLLGL